MAKPEAPTFCEALKKIQQNPKIAAQFTGGGDLYLSDITKEKDVLQDLKLPYTSKDGYDLQYFLVQYKMSRSVDRVSGFVAAAALELYVDISSAKSAADRGVGMDGYLKDINADMKGNTASYHAGIVGLDNYVKEKCDSGK